MSIWTSKSTGHGQDEKEEDENEPYEIVKCPVSHAEAIGKTDDVLTWYRFQPDATASRVSWLVQLREVAVERRESTRKQASISSFF